MKTSMCILCRKAVTHRKSYAHNNGRACKKHVKAKKAMLVSENTIVRIETQKRANCMRIFLRTSDRNGFLKFVYGR